MFCDISYGLSWRMSMCSWKNVYAAAAVGWNVLYISFKFLWSKHSSSPKFLYWFSTWIISPLLKVCIEPYCYYCIIIYFSLQFCKYLLNTISFYNIGYIYIYACYTLSINWSLGHCIRNFFVSFYSFWFKVYFFI